MARVDFGEAWVYESIVGAAPGVPLSSPTGSPSGCSWRGRRRANRRLRAADYRIAPSACSNCRSRCRGRPPGLAGAVLGHAAATLAAVGVSASLLRS